MAYSVSTVVIKDGNGTAIPGAVDEIDTSGTGAGPWKFAQSVIDGAGLSGAATTGASVKAASTAAAAGDQALVVAVSPNNGVAIQQGSNTAVVKNSAPAGTDQALVVALSPNGALPTGSNVIGSVSVVQGGNTAVVKAASTAAVATDPALVVALSPNNVNPNGSATSSNSAPVVIASDQAAVAVKPQPQTSGGLSRDRYLVPNNTTNRIVKASAGQVYKIRATNNSGTIAYIKLYDAASATVGTGTPVDTIMIPANSSGGAGIVDTTDLGVVHSTGITYIVTTGIADNDTTAPAANAYIVTIYYK